MPKMSDCVFVGIISLIVAFIIGMCISSMVDKKLNNVSVNIPDIVVDHKGCECKENKYYTAYTEKPVDNVELLEPFRPTPEVKTPEVKTKKKPKRMNRYDKIESVIPLDYTDDVEGSKQYAVAGCPDRRKKMKLYPDLVSCAQPNYMTAENYYNRNFEYPYIPGQSEETWLGADYDYTTYLANANKSYRIVTRNKKKTAKAPFPSNYWFQN